MSSGVFSKRKIAETLKLSRSTVQNLHVKKSNQNINEEKWASNNNLTAGHTRIENVCQNKSSKSHQGNHYRLWNHLKNKDVSVNTTKNDIKKTG